MSRLQEIKARLEAATPGPWRWDRESYTDSTGRVTPGLLGRGGFGVLCCDGKANAPNIGDGALIANAPADLALLLEIAEAAANLDRYEDFGDNIPCHACWPVGADGKAEFKRARKRLYDALSAVAPQVIGIPGPGSHGGATP